ncbi:MAG: hypothetical protein HQL65_19465 [Magnetococcales bacterium]|nr:hypothetical protein [Magnetococcales bacterium]
MANNAPPDAFQNDQWTTAVHLLGYDGFARQAIDIIRKATPPFAMTIGGRWGAGKTSMLRTLMRALGGKELVAQGTVFSIRETWPGPISANLEVPHDQLKKIKTVWFNPWQYQHEPHPLIPLLHEIREQLTPVSKITNNLTQKTDVVIEAGIHALNGMIQDISAKFGLSNTFKDFAKHVSDARQRQEKEHFSGLLNAQRFHLQFEKAVLQLVNAGREDTRARLVIFIDDLDRCHHKTAFDLLESIKLYLASRFCVFVFGLDRVHVEAAVEKAGGYSRQEAAQYVEKLFQVRLHLPTPSQEQLSTFIQGIMPPEWEEKYATFLSRILPPNPRAIKNYLKEIRICSCRISSPCH